MKPGSVVVAYLHGGEVAHSFHRSMRLLWQHDLTHEQRLRGFIEQQCGAGRITDGRNDAVARFLRTDGEWLAFIDADMGFDPDGIDRLVAAAYDPPNAENPDAANPPLARPIIGGLAFAQHRVALGPAGSTRLRQMPTVFRWIQGPELAGTVPIYDYPRDSLVEVDATGGAFFIVHRSVLEHLAREYGDTARPWFDEMVIGKQVFGEDITFFRRCKDLGYPVFVHTGVKTSHRKASYLTEETQQPLEAIPNFVVIPMKDRFDLTLQLVEQLAEQGETDMVFIFDNGSSEETVAELKATVWPSGLPLAVIDAAGKNIHQMWNAGIGYAVARAQPCNVAILNNDIRIGPRFLSGLARALRHDPLAAVASPNYDGRDAQGADAQTVFDICAGRYDGTGGIAGFAFMLKGEGGYRFPEQLQWWFGDNDMMCAVAATGMHGVIALGTTCEHIGGGSQTAGDWTEHAEQLAKDQAWFEQKWGMRIRPAAVECECACGGDEEGHCICGDLNDRVMA